MRNWNSGSVNLKSYFVIERDIAHQGWTVISKRFGTMKQAVSKLKAIRDDEKAFYKGPNHWRITTVKL